MELIISFDRRYLFSALYLWSLVSGGHSLTTPTDPRTRATLNSSSSASVNHRLPREEAQAFLDNQLLPKQEYGERVGWGCDAQGLGSDDDATPLGPLRPDDPRLSQTYTEFPLPSMDALLDLGMEYLPEKKKKQRKISMIDLGSGCGRLVFYSAMTRGSNDQVWDIYGIEISSLLHERGLECIQKGTENGVFSVDIDASTSNTFALRLGTAGDHVRLLQEADCIFAYSTAFSAKQFSPELGALILDREWSELLGQSCSPGCVAITTDRALDPRYGWKLLDRLDVENPDVFGTTGFVHILES